MKIMLNVSAVKQKPTEMELAATEIAVEIVHAVNTPPGALWDFNKINELISGVKNRQLRLMALQDTYFLLAYFNHFQGGAKNVLGQIIRLAIETERKLFWEKIYLL